MLSHPHIAIPLTSHGKRGNKPLANKKGESNYNKESNTFQLFSLIRKSAPKQIAYKSNYLVACLQINPTSKDITIKGRSAFKIPINTNTPSDIARYKAHLGTKRAESYPSELDGGIISGSIATLTPQVYQNQLAYNVKGMVFTKKTKKFS